MNNNNFIRSTSPSTSNQQQQQQQYQQQQGRSRSGTLPSSFSLRSQLTPNGHNPSLSNTSITLGNNNTSLTSSPIYTTDSLTNNNYNHDMLNIPTSKDAATSTSPLHTSFTSNNNGSGSGNNNNNNINLGLNVDSTNLSTTPTRRMRSGSLFSTNSIWNDDNNSSNSNHSLHSEFVMSPSLDATSPSHNHQQPQQQQQQQQQQQTHQYSSLRNRSYTTNAAIPSVTVNSTAESFNNYGNPTYNNGYYRSSGGQNKVSTSPFISIGGRANDATLFMDNFMLNGEESGSSVPRIRSQTYSGSTPPGVNEQLFTNVNTTVGGGLAGQTGVSGGGLGARFQFNPHLDSLQSQLNNSNSNSTGLETSDSGVITSQDIQPDLIDDYDFSQVTITTNFENTNLGPTRFLLFDNLPLYVDSLRLFTVLVNSNNHKSFGSVVSVKMTITTTSKLALVECTNIETAMNLKANFNHLEIAPGSTLYVAFAKIEEPRLDLQYNSPLKSVVEPNGGKTLRGQSNSPQSVLSKQGSIASIEVNAGAHYNTATAATALNTSHIIESITKLSSTADLKKIQSIINKCIAYSNDNYKSDFGPLPDPIPSRQFDSPTLRELRKVLENKEAGLFDQLVDSNFSQVSVDELALAMLDDLPEICYDYLGNTIVQKLFTLLDNPQAGDSLVKLMMVKEIAPYLTQLGIHKNGTWAIQKIINLCHSDFQQMYLIGASLKPYAVKLFNDQFGNYVIQGCIKFGSPFNDFVFEAMFDNFLEISFGRYGARCIRTILESSNSSNSGNSNGHGHHHESSNGSAKSFESGCVSQEQVLLVAGLILEFANELAVNSNGSLLITWYLDTFELHNGSKIDLIVDRFLPNLQNLCVHRLANLTILKILSINSAIQQEDGKDDVKRALINAIFENADNLKFILQERSDDNNLNAGPLFIYKVLSNPLLTDLTTPFLPAIKRVLMEINIVNFHHYKKLMDEVGLSSSRSGKSFSSKRGGASGASSGSGSSSGNNNNRRAQRNGNNGGSKYDSYHSQHHHSHSQPQQAAPLATSFHSQPIQQQFPMQQMPPQSFAYVPLVQPQQHQSQYTTQQPSAYMKQYYAQQAMAHAQQQQQQAQQQYYQQAQIPMGPPGSRPPQQQPQQPQPSPQELAVMQQLEQLSLSSAALGYNSNPGTPTVQQRNSYM
ncbi:hypothetical protein I9W82_005439 [Candida metapsilosis]|uniref:PUM-HD domain-containing protein n=1 Tax=Candida metapsilosis TaxID=273372 RepID=A0A8H8D945_9ASCO|nr:hypothetical protein I9W82_005439 [Candida metapsilosis]